MLYLVLSFGPMTREKVLLAPVEDFSGKCEENFG